MKLCVLRIKIDEKFLYTDYGVYLYHLPITEYRKQILKGNVLTMDSIKSGICYWYARNILKGRFELGEEMISKHAWGCHKYSIDVLKERFLLGEEMIKQSKYCKDYEKHFNIKFL